MPKKDTTPDVSAMQAELRKLTRERLAREIGVTPDTLATVRGDTDDEVKANAEKLLKAYPGLRTGPTAKPKFQAPGEPADAETAPTDEDTQKLAAAIRARMPY